MKKKIIDFKNKENLSKVLFIIISKSGSTIETITRSLMKITKKIQKPSIFLEKIIFLHLLAKI